MDKKIRAAAENDATGYDDNAWKDMEGLLDKHLPQEKKRRRVIFFLLIGLLVAGIPAFYFIRKSSSSGNKPLIENTTQDNTTNPNNSSNNQPSNADQQKAGTIINPDNNNTAGPLAAPGEQARSTQPISPAANEEGKVNSSITTVPAAPLKADASMSIKVRNSGVGRTKTNTQPAKQNITVSNGPVRSNTFVDPVPTGDKDSKTEQAAPTVITPAEVATPVTNDVAKDQPATAEPSKEAKTDSAIIAKTEEPVVKKDKKKSSAASKFIISASIGPDLSSVGTKTGKWREQYGVGLGYAINDKWTIRTGFYAARKVYTADTNSYKIKGSTGGPYPSKLHEIKANCLVYEIPVSVVYNFTKTKRHNWFVSAGVSSYLMKAETYDCSYVNQLGQWWYDTYSFKNENTHLFSVISLSGGYQYHFNKRLSLMAEPYLKMPVSGVGQGKVKLNSTGVLFTLGYKPFQKR